MSNEELIQELQMIVDCIKQSGQDWVDETDLPTFEQVMEKLSKEQVRHGYWDQDMECS